MASIQRWADDRMTAIVLGVVADPDHPERDREAILADLLGDGPADFERMLLRSHSLAGKFCVALVEQGDIRIFNDAQTLQQVYWHDDSREVILASDPALIRGLRQLHCSSDSRLEFFSSAYYSSAPNRWWPGNEAYFDDMYRLAPNHYYCSRSNSAHRFWPTRRLRRISPDAAAGRIAALLHGSVNAFTRQRRCAMPVTAGLDSRLQLAASRDCLRDLRHYIIRFPSMPPSHPDIALPQRMFRDFGQPFDVIDASTDIPDRFRDKYMASVFHPRTQELSQCYTVEQHLREYTVLHGVASEVGRQPFRIPAYVPVTPKLLAYFGIQPVLEYNIDMFRQYLEAAGPVANASGIPVLDLFYWEQKLANWTGLSSAEGDVSGGNLSIFSNRALYEQLLSVHPRYRRSPGFALYRAVIRQLWPELLTYPINPAFGGIRSRMEHAARWCLHITGVYPHIRALNIARYMLKNRTLPTLQAAGR